MTSEHVRAARALLRWEQKDLAEKSGISLPTIKRLETQPGALGAYPDTVAAIRKAFEGEGIEFFNGDVLGVWLRRCASASKPPAGRKSAPRKRLTTTAKKRSSTNPDPK